MPDPGGGGAADRRTCAGTRAIAAIREVAARLVLDGLDPGGVRALVDALFGELVGGDRLAAFLHRVARGNPMHTMELVRGLVDRGVLRYAEGMWMAGGELEAGAVSTRLSEAMRTRIGELPPDARAVAELVAVLGMRVPLPWCVQGADLPGEDAVFAAIDRLVFEQVLQGDDRALELRHDGLREALLAGLSPARRRELHARAARILSSAETPRPELEAQLGRHFLEAGEDDRGAELLERAGRRLYDAQSFFDALAPLEAALAVIRTRPGTRLRVAELQQMLTRAGVLVDRQTVLRHADEAIAAMDADSGMPIARRLAPLVGGKAALGIGIAIAFVVWLLRPRTRERPVRALVRMIAIVSYAASVYSLSMITPRVRALLELLGPLRTLVGRVPRGRLAAGGELRADRDRALAEARTQRDRDGRGHRQRSPHAARGDRPSACDRGRALHARLGAGDRRRPDLPRVDRGARRARSALLHRGRAGGAGVLPPHARRGRDRA